MILTTPTALWSGSTFWRRCCALLWLWGENRGVAVGLALQALFEPAPHPFAPFGFDFQFDLAQRESTSFLI